VLEVKGALLERRVEIEVGNVRNNNLKNLKKNKSPTVRGLQRVYITMAVIVVASANK
jgi:hypothetical protein